MRLFKSVLLKILIFLKIGFNGTSYNNYVRGAVILDSNFKYYDYDRLYVYDDFCDPNDYQCNDTEYAKLIDFYFTIEDGS